MGLDTTHNCWHGPYSAFTRWRNRLAEAAGYEVKPVTYEDGMTYETAMIDREGIERDNPNCYQGEWNTEPDDPMVYLIAHSDCDGVIQPQHAAKLADRIEELLPKLQDEGPASVLDSAVRFIRGLREAASAGEPVEFY